MNKLLTLSASTIFLMSAAGYAMAAFNQNVGPFIEANVGSNAYLTAIAVDDETFSHAGVHGMGWSAALGYKFTPRFGLEVGFMQNYADFDLSDDDDDDDENPRYDNDEENVGGHTNIPYGAMRFMFPIGDKFSIIAKLGAMHVSIETNDDDYDDESSDAYVVLPYTGLGVSYAVTEKIELLAQYQGALYGVVNGGLLSAGLAYNF